MPLRFWPPRRKRKNYSSIVCSQINISSSMNLQLFLTSLFGAIATASALSCACWNPNPTSFSNALYTKKYALKVDVKDEIIRPTPAPAPYVEGEPMFYMPYDWEPKYFEATVKDIFKLETEEAPSVEPCKALKKEKKEKLELKKGEKIVVRGGACSQTPLEDMDYILFSDYIHEMDVPGYKKAKVLDMPGYCEFSATWDEMKEMKDDREKQLKEYKTKGETPCFEQDCEKQMVAIKMPFQKCPDGGHVSSTMVCKYHETFGQCQYDLEMECLPPP